MSRDSVILPFNRVLNRNQDVKMGFLQLNTSDSPESVTSDLRHH